MFWVLLGLLLLGVAYVVIIVKKGSFPGFQINPFKLVADVPKFLFKLVADVPKFLFSLVLYSVLLLVLILVVFKFFPPSSIKNLGEELVDTTRELKDYAEGDKAEPKEPVADTGPKDPTAVALEDAEKERTVARNLERAAVVTLETADIHRKTGEKLTTDYPWAERFLLKRDFLYGPDGARLEGLEEGRIIRVNYHAYVSLSGFSEKLVLAIVIKSDGTETRGYIRPTSVSSETREDFESSQRKFGEWQEVHSTDPDTIFERVVTLRPGEASQTIRYVVPGKIVYEFVRTTKTVEFTAWVNGNEVKFRVDEHIALPHAEDLMEVKVMLSKGQEKIQTIRFKVRKA